jgi:hypothetical protein
MTRRGGIVAIALVAACTYAGRTVSDDLDARPGQRDAPPGAPDAPPGSPDAPPASPDAPAHACLDALCDPGTCDEEGWCVLDDCTSCTRTCPPGHHCRVRCGDGECQDGITLACDPTAECQIVCGDNACQSTAPRCLGAARCEIYCYGNNACQSGTIECTAATCDISCDPQGGSSNCDGAVDCDDAAVASCAVHCCGDDCGDVACGGCTPDSTCAPAP